MAKLEPIKDRIVVRRHEAANVTKGGIVIPTVALERPVEGKVIAVGPDVVQILEGDRVLFAKFSGSEVCPDGETQLTILREEEVLAIVR